MRLRSIVTVALLGQALTALPTAGQDALNGSWVIEETWGHDGQDGDWRNTTPQASLFMFMDGYYSVTYVRGNSPRPLMPEGAHREDLTPEQIAAILFPYISNAGRYQATASSVTLRPMVALSPNYQKSGTTTYTYEVQGDVLQLTETNPSSTWNARLRRQR